MVEELLTRSEEAVALALTSGADGAFAWARRSRGVDWRYRDGVLEHVEESTSRALSLELYADGRYSSHSTTDLRPDRLQAFVREAVALTRALQPDPHRTLPDPALYGGGSDAHLEQTDENVMALDNAAREAWLRELDEGARAAPQLISATSWLSTSHSLAAGTSSNGFSGTSQDTGLWFGTDLTLQDQGDARPEEGSWAGGHFRGGLPSPSAVAAEARDRARARLGSEKGPTAKTTMVVDNRAASRLLSALMRPASARSVQQARSFWAGKLGQRVVSDKLTIIDDPTLVRGLASRAFDSEGLAARRLTMVDRGVAQNLYVDTYYGKKAGMAPTTGRSSNLVVGLGDRDQAQLVADVGEGVFVTAWLGGNNDDNTGDFSFGLRGHRIQGGKIGGPIGEMNATGSLLDLFANLVAVGNDPFAYSSWAAPTLVFEGVQFSGA